MASSPEKVTVFQSNGVCFVDPGIVRISVADEQLVIFRNSTSQPVKLIFTDQALFRGVPTELAPGQEAPWRATPPASGALPYVTEYAVLCTESKTFAIGNSNPRIIVYP